MYRVANVFEFMCTLAPLELQMSFDNSGFLVGHKDAEVTKVITALDVTDSVIDEAIREHAELIISHHPIIWNAPKQLTDATEESAGLLKLIENKIAVISMHTNLDIVSGGVNDVLIDLLGADVSDVLDNDNCGRIGLMRSEMSIDDFLALCKNTLNANGLRYYSAGLPVRKLAVMGGAGADYIKDAFDKGCDTYVTSDIKYHQFQLAQRLGINLIDADHFCTEDPIIDVITEKLHKNFPELCIKKSAVHKQLVSFI